MLAQERFFRRQGTIAHLCSSLASALAFDAAGAFRAERRCGADEFGHPLGGDQFGKGSLEQVAQDDVGVVAGTDIPQRVEGVVGAFGARGAVAEPQAGEAARVHQTGLDRDRARDGQAKLGRGRVGDRECPADLLHGGEQRLNILPSTATGVEAVEHHRPCAEGKGQPQCFVQVFDIQACGYECGDKLPALRADIRHRGQDGIPSAQGARKRVVKLAPAAQ